MMAAKSTSGLERDRIIVSKFAALISAANCASLRNEPHRVEQSLLSARPVCVFGSTCHAVSCVEKSFAFMEKDSPSHAADEEICSCELVTARKSASRVRHAADSGAIRATVAN